MSIVIKNLILNDLKIPLNLEISKKCNVIIGNNGTGKTTCLDYIAGVSKDKKTTVSGNNDLIYMNQSLYFFDRLKVREFIKFIYKLNGIENCKSLKENIEKKYKNRYDFTKTWDKQIGLLSGGEKKIVYFLIIMSFNKEWYLLDEPFSGVDLERKNLMLDIINEKIKEEKGILLVTHEEGILDKLIDYQIINLNATQ